MGHFKGTISSILFLNVCMLFNKKNKLNQRGCGRIQNSYTNDNLKGGYQGGKDTHPSPTNELSSPPDHLSVSGSWEGEREVWRTDFSSND